jgi:hypothetical protein
MRAREVLAPDQPGVYLVATGLGFAAARSTGTSCSSRCFSFWGGLIVALPKREGFGLRAARAANTPSGQTPQNGPKTRGRTCCDRRSRLLAEASALAGR